MALSPRAALARVRQHAERARAWLAPRWRRHRLRLLAAAALALLCVLLWLERRPHLRVINTLSAPVRLLVDGRPLATIDPTSTETPGAGVELRLTSGFHKLTVQTPEGALVDELNTALTANSSYLLSPGDSDQCFWIEHTAYGQAQPEMPPLRRLVPEQRLWVIPDQVDAWFFPTPPPSPDKRSSGGTRTAIRQARCGFDPWR